MTLWLIRTGRNEVFAQAFIMQSVVVVGWELPDLTAVTSLEDINTLFSKAYPNEKSKTLANWSRQMWAFKEKIVVGDKIITPFNKSSVFAIGAVTGDYEYRPELMTEGKHIRPVQWLKKEIDRSRVAADLRTSLGSILTVCQISRNNAEERINAFLQSM